MDDPWGSPWTTTDVDLTLRRTPSPTKSELEPPPRAFLSTNSSPRLPAASSPSPWADDDDAFGDWASTNTPAEPAQPASPWAAWGGADVNTSREHLSTRPRDDSFTKETPIAWPGNIALSPGPKPATGSILRQLSPDPWASEFAAEGPPNSPRVPRLVIAEPPDSPITIPEAETNVTTENPELVWDNKARDKADSLGQGPGGESTLGRVSSDGEQTTDTDPPTTFRDDPPAGVSRISIKPRTRSIRSRSSSVSGDNSDRDTGRQDSPITSVDEDSKARSQLTSRKASGKVQDLVVKFDSLAKAAVEEPAPNRQDGGARLSRTDHGADDLEEGAEFGDFEDGGDAVSPAQTSRASSLERTPTPKIHHNDTVRAGPSPPPANSPTSPRAPLVDTERLDPIVASDQVQFDVDLGQVGHLFAGSKPGDNELQNEADLEVPDRPITDSFAGIAERKAWYRISRQGSSRMHNGGDDDSYCRIAWPASRTRQETLAIVRRWMEEDSITGRPTLGRGPSRRDMFGWDSAAEPVSLDKVFGKPRDSLPPKAAPPQHQVRVAPIPVPKSPVQVRGAATLPAASFGWSTTATAEEPKKSAPTAPTPSAQRIPLHSCQAPPALSIPPSNLVPPPVHVSNPQPLDGDDEDEWGDMVSSPQDDTKPTVSNGPGRLDNVLSEPLQTLVEPSKATPTPFPATAQHSILIPMSAVGPAHSDGNKPTTTSLTSQPWASVDFSFFDPSPKPNTTTITDTPTNVFSQITTVDTSTRKTTDTISPQTTKGVPYKNETEGSDDSRVRRVLNGLPDLSYMLR